MGNFNKTLKEVIGTLKLDERIVKKLVTFYDIKKEKRLYDTNDFDKIFQRSRKTPYKKILIDIMDLYKKYQTYTISMPHGLKGDYGELYSMQRIFDNLPDSYAILLGGSYPKLDIIFQNKENYSKTYFKKIQVKTQFNIEGISKTSFGIKEDFEVEFCPDITASTLPDLDYVFLVQVCITDDHEINHEKTHINIFNREDFHLFSEEGCWGAKRGKKTIWNFPNGIPQSLSNTIKTSKLKKYKPINHYNDESYKIAFRNSHEDWSRLED